MKSRHRLLGSPGRASPTPDAGFGGCSPRICQVYDGLTFKLLLSFTSEYPYKPPCVRFDSCWHPNVDGAGNICLDILKDKWSPVHNVRTVLLSIQSLLGGALLVGGDSDGGMSGSHNAFGVDVCAFRAQQREPAEQRSSDAVEQPRRCGGGSITHPCRVSGAALTSDDNLGPSPGQSSGACCSPSTAPPPHERTAADSHRPAWHTTISAHPCVYLYHTVSASQAQVRLIQSASPGQRREPVP